MTERLRKAAQIAGLDHENLDMALLVGAMSNLQQWAKDEPHLVALGKVSMCQE